jgi:PqqD family protein of HPr-rel-A system
VTRWASAPHQDLVWRSWDGISIVYHVPSGRTHFLNELGSAILRGVGELPRTTDEIRSALVDAYRLEASDELAAATLETLHTLDRLGLVLGDADRP